MGISLPKINGECPLTRTSRPHLGRDYHAAATTRALQSVPQAPKRSFDLGLGGRRCSHACLSSKMSVRVDFDIVYGPDFAANVTSVGALSGPYRLLGLKSILMPWYGKMKAIPRSLI